VNDVVSLIDIKPTLLQLLQLPSPKTDGLSLVPYLEGKTHPYPPRPIFTEIDFTPIALKSKKVIVQNAIYQSADVFAIEPNTKAVIMKKEMVDKLLLTKQRAIYDQDWVLALYPKEGNLLFPVLANRTTGQWTDDLSTLFAKHSPAENMFKTLQQFYGHEVTDHLGNFKSTFGVIPRP
jgi:hypothetical protein